MSQRDILIQLYGTLTYNVFTPVSSMLKSLISGILVGLHATLINNAFANVKNCVQNVLVGYLI